METNEGVLSREVNIVGFSSGESDGLEIAIRVRKEDAINAGVLVPNRSLNDIIVVDEFDVSAGHLLIVYRAHS